MTRHASLSDSGKLYRAIPVIKSALPHPSIVRNQPLVHAPIIFREEEKYNRGNIANGRMRHRITWLRLTKSVTLPPPRMLMIRIAGITASVREIILRSHGRMRQFMKPSITTCPANVPVIVLLCPLASSATAKSVLASVVPSSGANVR